VSRPRARLVGALALLGLAFAGCGKKGPPVAPEMRLPVPPTGLQASIDESVVVLTWSNPVRRMDGSALKDLTGVRLFRHEDGGAGPLKPAVLSGRRVAGYEEIATIRLDAAAPGDTARWVDQRGLALGRRYVYVATAIDSVGRSSPPSERRAITFLAAPKPPRALEATAGNRQATVTWIAPAEFTDESPVSGELRYVVLRGTGAAGPLAVVTPQPLSATSFTDTGLDNETEYRYAVRVVRVDPRATVTGAPSETVGVTPVETTPPAPPSNLVVVPSAGALRLAWSPSPAPNVAAYAIYRAVGAEAFVRIGTSTAGNTTFIDRDVQPGIGYRYAVSAIDNARKPNESVRSNEVTATPP
jgi:hypothetical protein